MTRDIKALGFMIFAGSASIGVMNNGVKPSKILEISDEIVDDNAMHFIHNYPEIPVVTPSTWENAEYLEGLKNEQFDLFYGNPPCSGLSLSRIGASADNEVNCHMYRYFDTVEAVQPKAFILENAPTLLTIGKPILERAMKQLSHLYNFSVVRDYGKMHGVAMGRQRTFFIGWRKDVFDTIPHIDKRYQEPTSVKDIIGDLYDVPLGELSNHTLIPNRPYASFDRFFEHLPLNPEKRQTICWTIVDKYEQFVDQLTEKEIKSLKNQLYKQPRGLGYWDKSPQRPHPDGLAPSMTGYVGFVHPLHNRQFTIREYARLMGFPDSFEFLETKDIVRHMAQGVPVKYFEYISGVVIDKLEEVKQGKQPVTLQEFEDTNVVFQQNYKDKHVEFTVPEFVEALKVDDVKLKAKQF